MEKLKPCPFCGSPAEIERKGTARASMCIVCTSCGCRVETGEVFGMTKPEHYRWNVRTAPDQQPATLTEEDKREAVNILVKRIWLVESVAPTSADVIVEMAINVLLKHFELRKRG
jgi:hypothetical protein